MPAQSKNRQTKRDEEGGTPPPCSGELGELVHLPKELLCHVFPGLPQSTVMGLSRSSRNCRQAAREAIPRIRAALVASVKDGWGRATGAQMRMLMTLLERFAGCRDISTNEPLQLQGGKQRVRTRYLSPEGDLRSSRQGPAGIKVLCGAYASPGPVGYDSAGTPASKMVLSFHFHGSFVNFSQEVTRGIVMPGVFECWVGPCESVDFGQALVLSFLPLWRGRVVNLVAPVRSLSECAAILTGCDVVRWYHDFLGHVCYTNDGADWAPETTLNGREIRVISHY
eukprot:jgi/Botrbrau1/7794/Bobra.0159s0222.1